MNRRSFLRQSILTTFAVSGGVPFLTGCNFEGNNLVILHTNDMHSHIEPFPADSKYSGLGGMARRATLIENMRRQNQHILVFDSGDIFQGTPYFNFFKGKPELELMTKMQYDAATLGNHEFDNGLEGLKEVLPFAGFPFLSANYDFNNTILKSAFEPYIIKEKGKWRVGIFGLGISLDGLVSPKQYGNTRYLDPVGASNEMVAELKQKNCDVIICLSHLGFQYEDPQTISDLLLAEQVSGIDIILGGHTHTFMDMPQQVKNPEGHVTTIHQVGWGGIRLGQLSVGMGTDNRKILTANSHPVNGSNV